MPFGDINREDYDQSGYKGRSAGLKGIYPERFPQTAVERRAAEREAAAQRRAQALRTGTYNEPPLLRNAFPDSESSKQTKKPSRRGAAASTRQSSGNSGVSLVDLLNPERKGAMGRSATSRRGTIADELEAQVEQNKNETKKTEYRSRRQGLDDVYPNRKPSVTETSPNTGNMPMNWAQYEEYLNNYGTEEGFAGIRLSGFESNDLPGGIEATLNTKPVAGISQAGASAEADINDQSRAHEVDQTKNRALPRGARQRQKFLERNPDYGKQETPKPNKGGLSARTKAFLAYDGKGGSLGAVRAADASQNLMRYGDKFAVKVGENEYKDISREGADAIRGGKRNDRQFEQEFLSQYLTTPAKPADAQSEDANCLNCN